MRLASRGPRVDSALLILEITAQAGSKARRINLRADAKEACGLDTAGE